MASESSGAPPEPHADVGPLKSFLALTSEEIAIPLEHGSTPSTSFGPLPPLSKQTTSFAPEVVQHLERTNPGVLRWLRSPSGVVFQVLLILAYILFYTISGLLLSYALKPDPPPTFKPLPGSMIVLDSLLTFTIGLGVAICTFVFSERLTVAHAAQRTFQAVFQWRIIVSYSCVAALIKISAVFGLMAYSNLDGGLKVVLDQLRLPVTASLSAVIVGKRYGMREWLALFVVLLAVSIFYLADVEHDEVTELHTKCRYPSHCFNEPSYDVCALRVDGPTILGTSIKDRRNVNGTHHDITTFAVKATKTDLTGLIFSLVGTAFNCVGSLFLEKLLKSSASTPFPVQMVQMQTTGLPVAIAMTFIVPMYIDPQGGKAIWWAKNEAEGSGEGFFQGFTGLTLIAIAMDNFLGWMGGIIIKQFSSVVKIIAKCFVLVLMVFCTGTFLKVCQADPLPLNMYSLAFIIGFATVLFATLGADQAAPAPAPAIQVFPMQQPLAAPCQRTDVEVQMQDGRSQ